MDGSKEDWRTPEPEPIRPHRRDGYRRRIPVKVRIDAGTLDTVDGFAEALNMSRAHACDVILTVAMNEGFEVFAEHVNRRVLEAIANKRNNPFGKIVDCISQDVQR